MLPVLFRYIDAVRKSSETVQVNFGIEHELEITRYEIEASSDGLNFRVVTTENPLLNNGGASTYHSLDNKADKRTFYRVNAINTDGNVITSPIVMVKNNENSQTITIFPNPVVNKRMNLSFTGAESGSYIVMVYDFLKKIHEATFDLADPDELKTVELPKTLSGTYNVVIVHNNAIVSSQSVIIK